MKRNIFHYICEFTIKAKNVYRAIEDFFIWFPLILFDEKQRVTAFCEAFNLNFNNATIYI